MASYIARRKFLATLGGAAAWPLAARAQQARKTHTIGFLSPSMAVFTPYRTVLFNTLRELGWIEGQNIAIERRYAENRLERLPIPAAIAAAYAGHADFCNPDIGHRDRTAWLGM